MRVHFNILMFLLSLGFSFSTHAQTIVTTTPLKSQKAITGQTIGLTDIAVTYHRPAVKEREVWGNLVPKNAVWRAGANENTVISFSKNVMIEGKKLQAGTYGFHLLPSADKWEVIFSNNSTSWGSYSYNEAEDALRVSVTPSKSDHFYELLTFTFDEIEDNTGMCALQWADKKIAFKVESDVHTAVLASLRNELRDKAGWTWVGWNEAANYCLKNNVNQKEALGWSTRSVFMNPNTQNMVTKAKLVAKVKGASEENEQEIILASLGSDLEKMNVTWKEWHGAGKFAMNAKAWEQAVSWIDQSISMSANMTNMISKAEVFENKGDADKAKKLRKEALDKGTNAELNMYAYQLMWAGKTAKAVEVFEANVERNPEDPNVWDSMGEGYFNNGDKEKAIDAFKKSLSMDPPDNVRANSMNILRQMGVEYKENKKSRP